MDNPVLVSISPERSNIIYLVRPKTSPTSYTKNFVKMKFSPRLSFLSGNLVTVQIYILFCRESLVQSLLPHLTTLMLLNIEKLKCSQVSILAKKESR